MKNLRLLMIAGFLAGSPLLASPAVLVTVRVLSGGVEAEGAGTNTFSRVSNEEKFPAGTTFRTDGTGQALISLLPGFAVGMDRNTRLSVQTVQFDSYTPPKRSVLINLEFGRIAPVLERYFSGRTSFVIQTGGRDEGFKDGKGSEGGVWEADSCGLASLESDPEESRDTQVVGESTWTSSSGKPIDVRAGSFFTDSMGKEAKVLPIAESDPAASGDRDFAIIILNSTFKYGLIDSRGCPGFDDGKKELLPPEQDSVIDSVLGRPFNPANAGELPPISPSTLQ